jgi:hypothetical protein
VRRSTKRHSGLVRVTRLGGSHSRHSFSHQLSHEHGTHSLACRVITRKLARLIISISDDDVTMTDIVTRVRDLLLEFRSLKTLLLLEAMLIYCDIALGTKLASQNFSRSP